MFRHLTVLAVLAILYLNIHLSDDILFQFEKDFDFGLASAPAHTENLLPDLWAQWANNSQIPHFNNVPNPEMRLQWWTNPEKEISLIKGIGVQSFRFGIDWLRVVPFQPGSKNCGKDGYVTTLMTTSKKYPCRTGVQDQDALDRYVDIIQMIRNEDIKVWITFFHHSLPSWSEDLKPKGWINLNMIDYYTAFVQDVTEKIYPYVDHYVTFNEPAVFANLVYGINMWPGKVREYVDPLAYWNLGKIEGDVIKVFDNIAEANRKAYKVIHAIDNSAQVGICKNIAHYYPHNVMSKPLAQFMEYVTNKVLMDKMAPHMDYMGINYYGKEIINIVGIGIIEGIEYSESGRAVSPNGFLTELRGVHEKWNVALNRNLPIYITENGIADDTDILRPAYIIEHMLAIGILKQEGIPIKGYHHWTISDNIEWADGYCPKFGLYSVVRNESLSDGFGRQERTVSANLYRKLIKTRKLQHSDRLDAWNTIKHHATIATKVKNDDFDSRQKKGSLRPFCRSKDGKSTPAGFLQRRIMALDWRVNYKLHKFGLFWWFGVKKDRE